MQISLYVYPLQERPSLSVDLPLAGLNLYLTYKTLLIVQPARMSCIFLNICPAICELAATSKHYDLLARNIDQGILLDIPTSFSDLANSASPNIKLYKGLRGELAVSNQRTFLSKKSISAS